MELATNGNNHRWIPFKTISRYSVAFSFDMENRAKTPARSGLAPPKTSNVVLNMPSPSAGAMRAASAQRSASTTKAGLPSGGLSGSSGTSTATRPPSRGAVPSSYASKPASEPVAAARPALPKKRASGGPRQLDAVVLAKAGSTPTVQPPDVVVFFEEEEDDATAVGGNGGDSGTDTLADDASLPDDVTKPFHPSPSVHSSSISIAGSDVAERGGANVRVRHNTKRCFAVVPPPINLRAFLSPRSCVASVP